MAFLEVEDLTKNFGGLAAVQGLNFKVHAGETLGLIGPNGSGKTTVLSMIAGNLKPTGGRILFNGENVVGLSPHIIAANGTGRMFQNGGIFTELSVLDNILVAGHCRSRMVCGTSGKRKADEEKRLAQEVLESVGLRDVMAERAGNLPPGKQKFLILGMLIISNPPLWTLDEPVAGMSAEEVVSFIDIINRFKRERGTTIVIVDHNMKVIMENCSRIIVLNYGMKIAEGTPDEISNNPDVIRVYLGSEDGIN